MDGRVGCPRSRIAIATSPTNLQRIIAFRNILIHRYSQVVDEIVWDIQQSGLLIAEITRGISFDEFNENWVVPAAVERHFTIIGEAMARLDEHHPTVATQISEHKTNIGFRIVLVHRYPEIRNQEVWESPSPTSQPSSTKSPTFSKNPRGDPHSRPPLSQSPRDRRHGRGSEATAGDASGAAVRLPPLTGEMSEGQRGHPRTLPFASAQETDDRHAM